MRNWMIALLVGVSLVIGSALHQFSGLIHNTSLHAAQSDTADEGALTTADYIEIQQLYARYNHYIDSVKDDGYAYARLFTSDGVFDTTILGVHTGHDELAALCRTSGRVAEVSPNHIAYNIMIEPSAEGAVGAAYYVLVVQPAELGQEVSGSGFGMYNDRFVKTADGWRFKHRTFIPAGTAVPSSDQ